MLGICLGLKLLTNNGLFIILKDVLIGVFFFTTITLADFTKKYNEGFLHSKNGNHSQAFKIMLNLANNNYPPAIQNVALSYKYGLGINKNKNKALLWFKKSHNAGILDGTTELANIYYANNKINLAKLLWQQASEKNDKYATYNLAMLKLEQGFKQKSYQLLLKAKKLGHPQAKSMLKKYYD